MGYKAVDFVVEAQKVKCSNYSILKLYGVASVSIRIKWNMYFETDSTVVPANFG